MSGTYVQHVLRPLLRYDGLAGNGRRCDRPSAGSREHPTTALVACDCESANDAATRRLAYSTYRRRQRLRIGLGTPMKRLVTTVVETLTRGVKLYNKSYTDVSEARKSVPRRRQFTVHAVRWLLDAGREDEIYAECTHIAVHRLFFVCQKFRRPSHGSDCRRFRSIQHLTCLYWFTRAYQSPVFVAKFVIGTVDTSTTLRTSRSPLTAAPVFEQTRPAARTL